VKKNEICHCLERMYVFRYDIKNAAKIEEERRIQAEIDEENSCKNFRKFSKIYFDFFLVQKSITPKLLYKYLNELKKNILLIDMRLKSDYDQSHMRTPACIHIPADLMNGKGYEKLEILSIRSCVFRWTTWGIESTLTDGEALKKFKQRADFDYIVLFDDDSYEDDLKPGNPLMGLKQAIFTVGIKIRF